MLRGGAPCARITVGSSERDEPRRLPAQARPAADARAVRRRGRGATHGASSSSATTPGASTTTSGSSGTARSRAGRCRRGCRSARASAISPSTSRITRSTTRSFEGVIPAGQYGAGTVEIWDSGTYELLEEKRDGGLTFRLHGERLDGVWTLVPAHLDGDERNWLLLRKDAAARGSPPTCARSSRRSPRPCRPARAGCTSRSGTATARSWPCEAARRRSRAATATTSPSASARSRGRSSTPSARPPPCSTARCARSTTRERHGSRRSSPARDGSC